MKYEAIKVEIVLIDKEDILTLSNRGSNSGNSYEWDDLDFN